MLPTHRKAYHKRRSRKPRTAPFVTNSPLSTKDLLGEGVHLDGTRHPLPTSETEMRYRRCTNQQSDRNVLQPAHNRPRNSSGSSSRHPSASRLGVTAAGSVP